MQGEGRQTNQNFRLSVLTIIFIVLQLIFIILLAVSLSNTLQSEEINDDDSSRIPTMTIANFGSVAPGNYSGKIELLERTLLKLALANSSNKNISTAISAEVRDGSVKTVYFEDQDINYFSAIVDIPSLEQSYWFYNEYSENDNNQFIDYSKTYRIFCLEDTQGIIYPDFDCKDDFGSNGRKELVSELISYFNFNYFSPSYSGSQDSNEIRINPHNFDIDDDTKQSYIQQTKDAIDSLGIPSSLFTYRVVNAEDIKYFYPPR